MTYGEFDRLLKETLRARYDAGEAQAIAALIWEEVASLKASERLLLRDKPLGTETEQQLRSILAELTEGKPVQYALGEAWFNGRRFRVTPAVLIPRPETEELVSLAVRHCQETAGASQAPRVLDVGTGSGCIAISLKLDCPDAEVTALDISEAALNVARDNATRLDAEVRFLQLDFTRPEFHQQLGLFDLIVSNPPYIPQGEEAELDEHVRNWEPSTALFVPDGDPLLFYRLLSHFAEHHLPTGGMLLAECHQRYARAVARLWSQAGFATICHSDLNGHERLVSALKTA